MKTTSLLFAVLFLFCGSATVSKAQGKVNYSPADVNRIFFQAGTKANTANTTLKKATNPNLPVSTTFLTWSSTQWDSMSRSLFVYNNDDLVEVTTRQSYQGSSSFVTSERDLHTYDTAGNEIENINQEMVNGNWVNNRRDTSAFDVNGMEILSLNQMWENGAWRTIFGNRNQITKNASGEMTEMIQQTLDTAGQWIDETKITFTHNASGKIDGGTVYMADSTGAWEPVFRIINATFLSNDFNNPTSYTIQIPAPFVGWINAQRFTTYYNATTKLADSSLTEKYEIVTRTWSKQSKENYTYDSKGNQVLYNTYTWVNNAWEMESGQKDSIAYNSQGNIAVQVTQYWNSSSQNWENGSMQVHAYPDVTAVMEHNIFSAHKIYPNPAREMLSVEAQGVKTDRVRISVTDITGRMVYNNNINTNGGLLNTTINTSELKSGIYIMQIQAGSQVVNQKIVKE